MIQDIEPSKLTNTWRPDMHPEADSPVCMIRSGCIAVAPAVDEEGPAPAVQNDTLSLAHIQHCHPGVINHWLCPG